MTRDLPAPGTRQRLTAAMLESLRTCGYHGVGLSRLLVAAEAPKGVLYHHFPGGKSELAVHALRTVTTQITDQLDQLVARTGDPVAALRAWMTGAERALARSGFERGCPLATVALESTATDVSLRAALAEAFTAIRGRLSAALVAAGLSQARARSLAALLVSGYEGALLQARVAGSVEVMRHTCEALLGLVEASLVEANSDPPAVPSQAAASAPRAGKLDRRSRGARKGRAR
jgi:TetR/AcrR family transcriptional repressor of lmrAB and yxaGH operons